MKTSKETLTDSGIPVKTFYLASPPASETSTGFEPGKFPFTRGIYPTLYRERVWTMRQHSGFGLESLAGTEANLVPAILDAVEDGATNGEISNSLRQVFGEYKPKISF